MIENFFNTQCILKKPSTSVDAGGAVQEIFAEDSTFYGYLEALNSNEILRNEKYEVLANYRLYCPVDISIVETDRVEISGNEYKVFSIIPHHLSQNTHLEVYLLRES